MKRYFGLRGQGLHNAIATLAGIGFILFGYDQGVMSGLLTLPSFVEVFPQMDTVNKNLTPKQAAFNSKVLGVVIAIYEIGCMFGALATLYVGDKIGRRKTVFGGAIIMCIGAAIQCAAFALSQFTVGRIITGIGNGFVTATVPMWQSECAKAEKRGPMVMIEGALIIAGLALAYWVDFAFYFVDGQVNWRLPIAFQCVLAGILIAFILKLPESPRWLCKKGRIQEAKSVFAALENVPEDGLFVRTQIDEIVGTLNQEQGARAALKTMCTYGKQKHCHRAMLAIWSQAMQQLSGTNLITYYATSIYQVSIGLSPVNARVVGACQNTAYLFVACISIFTIERVGRRKLLLIGSIGQASSMAILAGTVYLANGGNGHAGIAAALFIFIFNAFFGLGWLGIPWLYPAEIVSLDIRAPVNGLSTATDWVLNFMVVMITPVAFNSIGVYTYAIFAAMNLLMFFVVYVLYPETSHRSLEEIDVIFEGSDPWKPWEVVGMAAKLPVRHPTLDNPTRRSSIAEAGYPNDRSSSSMHEKTIITGKVEPGDL